MRSHRQMPVTRHNYRDLSCIACVYVYICETSSLQRTLKNQHNLFHRLHFLWSCVTFPIYSLAIITFTRTAIIHIPVDHMTFRYIAVLLSHQCYMNTAQIVVLICLYFCLPTLFFWSCLKLWH